MKRYKLYVSASVAISLFAFMAVFAVLKVEAVREFLNLGNDPDVPPFMMAKKGFDKEEFMQKRADQVALYRGMKDGDVEENIVRRTKAIEEMEKQEEELKAQAAAAAPDEQAALLAAWTPIGPDPIPNGQTESIVTAVSGRVTAIAVHPTNADIVYVGTAQGGVYRSTNGGTNWTPLLDNAASLAIGAIAIAPSQPDTIYVGTGEGNLCGSGCYYGVGIYRIDNASTANPAVNGPFGSQFTGRGIAEILVHPTNPATIFVASTSAIASINAGTTSPTGGNRGIYRSTNATSAAPTFAQLSLPAANQDRSVRDMALDPLNPNFLVLWRTTNDGGGSAGIYVTSNALDPVPVFVQRFSTTATTNSEANGEVAIQRSVGAPQPTVYVATGNLGGRVLKSTDGGATFPQQIDNNFCTPQCFYDIAIDVDPTDPNRVYLGGAPAFPFGFSITGGTAFVTSSSGLHADSHVITVSPSNPNIIYFGSDGGIYRSNNQGLVWNVLNNAGFRATQFMGLDTHPTDPNITIGGTQDNGTSRYKADATWTRTDYGDGGYSVIDQSSSNSTTFNQYHTYFNASNLTGYAFSSSGTAFENWTFRGCNSPPTVRNGITCTAVINFYAPLERGPGTPNSIYYGADRLYRSVDTGGNHTTVSQTFPSALSAIGISQQNDNVRIIGLNNGGIFGTTTGTTPLVDLDPANVVPNNYVTRTIIDPTNSNTAYVTLAVFNAPQIYRTTNLSSATPTWTAISSAATGLPEVPVNAFAVENNVLYAGTDIGVYISTNGGTNWTPFGFGLPKVAVFDMAFAGSGADRVLRIATHGKGLYQIPAAVPQAILSISGTVTYGTNASINVANASLSAVSSIGEPTVNAASNGAGGYTLNNLFTNGQYTVTPTKTGDRNGISPFDATLVLRHIAANGQGANALNANQRIAADTSGDGNITPFDATLILRYIAAGAPNANTGQVGNWKFDPVSRPYQPLNNSVSGHNYTAFLIGEISGS
ncbi:MAG TPA: hypothetical protein VF648_13250 [Pyrinomonadaceae bacterium]|jgi:hypothetical protein